MDIGFQAENLGVTDVCAVDEGAEEEEGEDGEDAVLVRY